MINRSENSYTQYSLMNIVFKPYLIPAQDNGFPLMMNLIL